MLDAFLLSALAQSITDVVLAPAIHHAQDVTQIHVLQDALQKLRLPRYAAHPDCATGYATGQTFYATQPPILPCLLEEVVAVLRGTLARQDHNDLNAFYQFMGCPPIDYAYRVGFVLGWLTTLIDDGKAPVYDGSPCRTGARI